MIIACPACGTRYAVPDSAIGSEGRTVRCAKCKHSWFQERPELELDALAAPEAPAPAPPPSPPAPPAPETAPPPASPVAQPAPSAEPVAPVQSPSIDHWRTADAGSAASDEEQATLAVRALRRGLAQQVGGEEAPPPPPILEAASYGSSAPKRPFDDELGDDDDGSSFHYRAPFTRRGNTLRMWTIAAAIFAVLATGTVVAVNYSGLPLPEWLPLERPTFGIGKPGLVLNFPRGEQRSETLPNGDKIFRVRGTVSNTSRETLAVPNLLVVFSDTRQRPVGDWVVAPAKRELTPGESVNVTEAIANIPPGAVVADLGWAPN